MSERILKALRKMIEFDETMKYVESDNGTFNYDEDENADWLIVLQEAQHAYFEATGEAVPNALGVCLIPGKESLDGPTGVVIPVVAFS